ncbi:MAG TPA: MFS transporter [Rhodopila sp.]|jgi:MFS family permease|nr:MFS transporter [Rhodopila sp.]
MANGDARSGATAVGQFPTDSAPRTKTKLNRQQIAGFWASWAGWLLDGMDSVIYALVLVPALTDLLPRSGYAATPGNIGFAGSILFALFLVGWGFGFIWGPIADRFGRTKALAGTVLVYAFFTGAAALTHNVWELALCRLLAGVGIGGEWAMAGTYVSESWPEDRRKMGVCLLHTGYYFGFFVAAALNLTVGAAFGWRAMFLCGLVPVLVSIFVLHSVHEPDHWQRHQESGADAAQRRVSPLRQIFDARYGRRTLVNSLLLTVAIIGLWAGAVYEPAAIVTLARQLGWTQAGAARAASYGTAILSIGTILGCVAIPLMAETIGRRWTLAVYFVVMLVTIPLTFGWAYYLPPNMALPAFMALLFVLGLGGANFGVFSIWLPEQYGTEVRATAFAFCASIGRFAGAGVNFALAAAVSGMGTLGTPVAVTAIAFALGLLVIPFATETKGQPLPK